MAGDWLKMRIDLHDDPAVIAIAQATGQDEDAVAGKLLRLWGWVSRQTIDGNAPSVTEKWIDRYLRVEGFARAMVAAGWLIVTEAGIQIPKWNHHNSESAKSRLLAAKRAARHKAKKGNAKGNAQVTVPALPTEEKNIKTDASHLAVPASTPAQSTLFPKNGKAKKPKSAWPEVPTALDTPGFLAAWKRWTDYLGEKRKRYPSIAAEHLKIFAAMGEEVAVAAVQHSITRGYNEPFAPDDHAGPRANETTRQRIERIAAARNGTNGAHP